MSTIDKKVVSILIVAILLVTMLMPTVTLATTDTVTIKDTKLKEDILSNGIDVNNDGIITKQEMANLTHIWIDDSVTDLTGLEYATNLIGLDIRYRDKMPDFSTIEGKELIFYLSIPKGVTNVKLDFVKQIKNLKGFSLTDDDSTGTKRTINLSVLKEVKSLQYLKIEGDSLLGNMNNIKDCQNLTDLSLVGNSKTTTFDTFDLAGVSKLSNLKFLSLENLSIKNISELGKLSNLENLYFQKVKGISQISSLANNTKLESFYIDNSGGAEKENIDLAFLKDNKKLREITTNNCSIKNTALLANLKNLEYLSLYYTNLNDKSEYANVQFSNYNAYLGEKSYAYATLATQNVGSDLNSLFTFQANSDVVTINEDGYFKAEKIGEATITATAKIDASIKKTFKIKVNGISASQALGTKMGSSIINGNYVLKANGDLLRVYANDEKAQKVASNVQKCVYDAVYNYENARINAFPYSLLLKKDGTIEYEFNGVKSVLTDGKDIYKSGYLKKDGTYVEIQIDGTWKKITDKVEKIVGSYLVKKDGKTYDVSNNLVCNFPIKQASENYVVDNSDVVWRLNGDSQSPIKVASQFDSFVNEDVYKDKSGNYKSLATGEKVETIDEYSGFKLTTDGKLYFNEKLILTNVKYIDYFLEMRPVNYKEKYIILREDGSTWVLYLDGDGKLIKLQETEQNVHFKSADMKEKVVHDNAGSRIKALTGFNTKQLAVGQALSSKVMQNGYTAKVFDGNKQLKSSDKIFTGAKIEIYNSKGELVSEYTALVYGDVTGSGNPSAKDALAIIKNKMGKGTKLTDLQLEAARVTENSRKKGSTPTSADALAIVKAKLGKYTIK